MVKVECQVRGFLCDGVCDHIAVDRNYRDGYQDIRITGPGLVVIRRRS